MTPAGGADLLSILAFGCLTMAALGQLRAALRRAGPDAEGKAAKGDPGLAWIRAGILGLWAALALRVGFGAGGADRVPMLTFAITLAYTALLHLGHAPGWKGAATRRAGLCCWALAAIAFTLGLAGGIR